MNRLELRWPASTVLSLAAATATWVTLLTWAPFSERSSRYLIPLLGFCLLVAVVGALLRAVRVPAVLVACAQVLVLALWLHRRWAGEAAVGGWLPTPESLDLVRLTLAAAVDTAREYAAPIPRDVPQMAPLLVTAGAATAVLVDLLACGLRRAPLAGLPLLAAFTAPVSILDGGVPWWKFAAAAMAFLLLLAAQEGDRFTRWGQQVSVPGLAPDPLLTGQAVWTSARRIGLSATALAVVVPLVVPTFSVRLFDGRGPGGSGEAVSLTNPIVDMRRDLVRGRNVDLLQIRTEGDPSYLRTTVLDAFDGDTWEPSRRQIPADQQASGLMPRPPGLDAAITRRSVPWRIQVSEAFESRWLPTPYPNFSIEAPDTWRYDSDTLDILSLQEDVTAAGLNYSGEAFELTPTRAQLEGAAPASADVFGPSTELPAGTPELVRSLAREVTADADSKYEQALALQQWFREDGGFTYSLAPPAGNGLDDTVRFLTEGGEDGRVGYCEQFASTMALMSRTLDIPARVVVGFLRPERVAADTYVYRSYDLHAWPELYFEGIGWVRFEPTPADRTGAAPAYTRAAAEPEPVAPDQQPTEAPLPNLNRFDEETAGTDAGAGAAGSGGPGAGTWLAAVAGALALAALLVAPRGTRTWLRRRRWAQATSPAALAETSWAELRDGTVDLGLDWDDTVTLRTRARDLAESFADPSLAADDRWASARGPQADPEAAAALDRVVHRLELARYARPGTVSATERSHAEDDVARCLEALAAGVGRGRRWRSRWIPASLRPGRRRAPRPAYRSETLVQGTVDHAV